MAGMLVMRLRVFYVHYDSITSTATNATTTTSATKTTITTSTTTALETRHVGSMDIITMRALMLWKRQMHLVAWT